MGIGRILRKMGLPLWTFIGVGVSVTWFTYVEKLAEKFINRRFHITDTTWGWKGYLAEIILTAVPVIIVGLAWLHHQQQYNAKRMHILGRDLLQPQGKKVLILLVSNEGHAMHAVKYHFENMRTLKVVWLVPSNNLEGDKFGPSSMATAEKIKGLCKSLVDADGRSLEVHIHEPGVSPADSQDTFDSVNRIFRHSGYQTHEVIADFTGGTKPMTTGMIMACLPRDRELEYVSLNRQTGEMHGPFLIDYQHSAFDLVG